MVLSYYCKKIKGGIVMVDLVLKVKVSGCNCKEVDSFDIINAVSNAVEDGFLSHGMSASIKEFNMKLPEKMVSEKEHMEGNLNEK